MNERQKKKRIIILVIVGVLAIISLFFADSIDNAIERLLREQFNIVSRDGNLMVHFINVGQGDAVAINLPNDEVMLIDTGPRESSVTLTNYLYENVLNDSRDRAIDYMILTHADADHIGGALRVLENFDVKHIYMPIVESDTDTYLELKSFVEDNDYFIIDNIEAIDDDENFSINVFGPFDTTDENDSCPIIKLGYLGTRFLFMADISTEIEEKLLDADYDIESDVIKIAHHGGNTSSSLDFLIAVSADYSVISCGENNFGHPTAEVIENINQSQSKLIRTDIDGNILFEVGAPYEINLLTTSYTINGSAFRYYYVVIIIEIAIMFNLFILLIKKDANKKTR